MGLVTYLYIGVVTQLLSTMDIQVYIYIYIYNPSYHWFSGAHLVGNCPATSKISPKELRKEPLLLSIESWQFYRHSYDGIKINTINYKQRV